MIVGVVLIRDGVSRVTGTGNARAGELLPHHKCNSWLCELLDQKGINITAMTTISIKYTKDRK